MPAKWESGSLLPAPQSEPLPKVLLPQASLPLTGSEQPLSLWKKTTASMASSIDPSSQRLPRALLLASAHSVFGWQIRKRGMGVGVGPSGCAP